MKLKEERKDMEEKLKKYYYKILLQWKSMKEKIKKQWKQKQNVMPLLSTLS